MQDGAPGGKIKHLVVVMLENRSFDNLLGWTYRDTHNRPPINIPNFLPPFFNGLTADMSNPDGNGGVVPVTFGTSGKSPSTVPDPDPQELFNHMRYQMFRTQTPSPGQAPTMDGFVIDYATVKGNKHPNAIMECHAPNQVPTLHNLARNYAVCDRWFGSVPCQTWPNRAFVHAGTSCGRVNNCDGNADDCVPDPGYFDTPTVFNFLKSVGVSWKVYNDTFLISLTRAQFFEHLGSPLLEGHFRGLSDFEHDARHGHLPTYSFIEPSFLIEPNDQHPPHDIRPGDALLARIWKAVSTGRAWHETLLVITYDEHGGCFDHVAPPNTATPPDDSRPQEPFDFKLYGTRVPAVLVSPYIEAGTVFRSPSRDVEYDHTSILATLRNWVDPGGQAWAKVLPSRRIAAAPTLDMVLTRSSPRADLPTIPSPSLEMVAPVPDGLALNSNQRAIVAGTMALRRGGSPRDRQIVQEVGGLRTRGDARTYLGV